MPTKTIEKLHQMFVDGGICLPGSPSIVEVVQHAIDEINRLRSGLEYIESLNSECHDMCSITSRDILDGERFEKVRSTW